MGNGFVLSKDTWDHMPEEQRQWIMFETMQAVNTRLRRLERWNRFSSFCGGIIGGLCAAIGIKVGG